MLPDDCMSSKIVHAAFSTPSNETKVGGGWSFVTIWYRIGALLFYLV